VEHWHGPGDNELAERVFHVAHDHGVLAKYHCAPGKSFCLVSNWLSWPASLLAVHTLDLL
jgi:hypothetical protein